jgi:hypothetical protein
MERKKRRIEGEEKEEEEEREEEVREEEANEERMKIMSGSKEIPEELE